MDLSSAPIFYAQENRKFRVLISKQYSITRERKSLMKLKRKKINPFTNKEWKILQEELLLSPRQTDIIKLMCNGYKNYAIAQSLGISIHTVRAHLKKLYMRLDVADRFELICLMISILKAVHNK